MSPMGFPPPPNYVDYCVYNGSRFRARTPISLKHIYLLYPFMKPQWTTYHSTIGIQLRQATKLDLSFVVWKHILPSLSLFRLHGIVHLQWVWFHDADWGGNSKSLPTICWLLIPRRLMHWTKSRLPWLVTTTFGLHIIISMFWPPLPPIHPPPQ